SSRSSMDMGNLVNHFSGHCCPVLWLHCCQLEVASIRVTSMTLNIRSENPAFLQVLPDLTGDVSG
ncbi:MAG: hypothetical protein ACK50J_19690, partial [Planctomyces sp.]